MHIRSRIPLMNTEGNPTPGGNAAPTQQKVLIEVAGAQGGQRQAADFQGMTLEQFNARLAEERAAGRKDVLKAAGVKKEERAQFLARLEAGELVLSPKPQAGELDYKAEYEKAKPQIEKVQQYETKLQQHTEFFKKLADEEFAKLPEAAQKDIVRRKIDDPEARLAEIAGMRESGLLPAGATAAITQQGQQQQRAAEPATTMASPGPKVMPTAGTKTANDQYQELLKGGNKVLAARFYNTYRHEIERTAPTK